MTDVMTEMTENDRNEKSKRLKGQHMLRQRRADSVKLACEHSEVVTQLLQRRHVVVATLLLPLLHYHH